MRVLYFGTFDPAYGRNWVLMNGLRRNGVQVIELRRPPGRLNILRLVWDYLKLRPRYDAMIVGFSGQEVMMIARLLTRKPIIFDAFTSHYGGYILNRRKASVRSLRARYYRFLDRWSCWFADAVLLESEAYIDFFTKEYGLPRRLFHRVWIGANDERFRPTPLPIHVPGDDIEVIFFGTYVPVQGAEYIVRAAHLLRDERVRFVLCGKGQDGPKARQLADALQLTNITFHGMLNSERLRQELAAADISLGNFGDTPLAPLVVSNKVYEALAMQRPVITSDMPANREFFADGEAVFVPVADPSALAQAIRTLAGDFQLRERIARRGYEKFLAVASPDVIGAQLRSLIVTFLP